MKRIKASVSSKQHGFEDLLCPLIAQVSSWLVLIETDAALHLRWSALCFVWQQVVPAAFGWRWPNLVTCTQSLHHHPQVAAAQPFIPE